MEEIVRRFFANKPGAWSNSTLFHYIVSCYSQCYIFRSSFIWSRPELWPTAYLIFICPSGCFNRKAAVLDANVKNVHVLKQAWLSPGPLMEDDQWPPKRSCFVKQYDFVWPGESSILVLYINMNSYQIHTQTFSNVQVSTVDIEFQTNTFLQENILIAR